MYIFSCINSCRTSPDRPGDYKEAFNIYLQIQGDVSKRYIYIYVSVCVCRHVYTLNIYMMT